VAQRAVAETPNEPFLVLAEPCGTKPVTIAAHLDSVRSPAFDQGQACQHSGARPDRDPSLVDPPIKRRAVAQHRVDMAGDIGPVFGADITPATKVISHDIVRRPITRIDFAKNVDRGGDLCPWCQASPKISGPAGS
jgi:hypothetical protein